MRAFRLARVAVYQIALAAALLFPALRSQAQDKGEVPHFHHVHLNTTDPQATIQFYRTTLSAVPMKFMGKVDSLFTERSFILMNVVDKPIDKTIKSGIWHIGWGGVDVPNEYAWFKSHGVNIHTDLYQLGNGWVTYLEGPSGERIEVNTQGHHRYSHIHLTGEDPNKTVKWYLDTLNIQQARPFRERPKPADLTAVRSWSNSFDCDNVNIICYNQPNYKAPWWEKDKLITKYESSKGGPIDHYAFSYRKIEPVFERMKASGVQILEPIVVREKDGGFKSFFIQGPDGVVVEIVESKPIPEGIWE